MEDKNNAEGFEEFMRRFLAGQSGIDPEKFADAAGLPQDPAALSALLDQIKNAMSSLSADRATSGVNWEMAVSQAKTIARSGAKPVSDDARKNLSDAIAIGVLWLNESTSLAEIVGDPKLLTRELWVADAMPLFQELSQPVANRMNDALAENLTQNAPEELAQLLGDAGNIMRTAGGAMFAMQLGQSLGKLSQEVLSGGDIGLPIFKDSRAAFVPQNIEFFINESDIEADQAYIYLAIREMAHARLFRHSKWLRDAVVSLITTYAAEISIDTSRIAEIAEGIDPENMEELRGAFESGAFIAERTEHQQIALKNIETLLALIEGWVDAVTEDSTKRLPRAAALAEAVRRRRATGGPAETTFGTLVGLQLRPRRMREAAAMWKQIGDELGIEKRDALWDHPDVLPTGSDIDNPAALIARINGSDSSGDEFDQALRDLLGE